MEYGYYAKKDEWDMTRFLGYLLLRVNTTSSKTIKLTDVIKFTWDEDADNSDTIITNSEVERLAEKAKKYAELLK